MDHVHVVAADDLLGVGGAEFEIGLLLRLLGGLPAGRADADEARPKRQGIVKVGQHGMRVSVHLADESESQYADSVLLLLGHDVVPPRCSRHP